MLPKVKATIAQYSLLDRGDRVVVAVSGGPDSVCLLTVLHELSRDLDLSLHVAHLDHMFRGKESADEAQFVADLATKLGFAAVIEKFDVPAYCRSTGLSPQAGARRVRYDFLSRVALETKADRIATGHTASDQAETFLLRLLRGAGVSGLSSIPPLRGNIIRPLLGVTREEVLLYLEEKGSQFVTDPSNAKPVYARNRIRLELLPLLKHYNPRIIETLAAEATLLQEEDAVIESCLLQSAGVMGRTEEGVTLDRKGFNALPLALRRRLLKKAVDAAGGMAASLSHIQVDEALHFQAHAQTGRVLQLAGGLVLLREYERFLIREGDKPVAFSEVLRVPGRVLLADPALEIETSVSSRGEEQQEKGIPEEIGGENYLWQAQFDYDKIAAPLRVRNRAAGDWFCPSGMGGKRKKLQDFFVDARVPRSRRDLVPLLSTADSILWVMGLRTDERFRPGPGTSRVLTVTARRR